MILVGNNDPSERFTDSHARMLREDCDDVRTYRECGWVCVLGYRLGKRIVHAHCNSAEELERRMRGPTERELLQGIV